MEHPSSTLLKRIKRNSTKKVPQKKAHHPYFKLFLPFLICLAFVLYGIVSLTQSGVYVNNLTNNANYTGYISHKDLKSVLNKCDKDILIDAIFSVSTNDQLIKLLDYIHQLHPPTNYKQFSNITSNVATELTTNLRTEVIIPVHSNVSEYHLFSMSKDLLNAKSLISRNNKPQRTNNKMVTPDAQQYEQLVSLLIERSSQYKNTIFYKDLQKYKLELQTITLNGQQTSATHPINGLFLMYPKTRIMEYFLCDKPWGYGNGLSVYWGVRSIAYWMNYNFKISCKEYEKTANKNKYFSAFLPSNIASNVNIKNSIDFINENETIITFMPGVDPVPGQHGVIHPTSLLFMYYNAYFGKIMNYETIKASIDFYNYINDTERINSINKMSETNDIVLHIRCGDVLVKMHHVIDYEYGFLTMEFYKYVMNIGLKNKFGINWYDKITNNTNVWIISQLTHNSARQGELKAMKDCDYLIHYMVDNGLSEIFKPANIKIIYDSDVNDDFYRMLVAPLLFCSPSTFCFNAGIANMNGIVIVPNRGAWVDFKNIDDENEQDYIVANNSYLIPKNHLIIDTELSGWHCNKIDNYQFTKQTYKQDIYTQRLAEYLVAH